MQGKPLPLPRIKFQAGRFPLRKLPSSLPLCMPDGGFAIFSDAAQKRIEFLRPKDRLPMLDPFGQRIVTVEKLEERVLSSFFEREEIGNAIRPTFIPLDMESRYYQYRDALGYLVLLDQRVVVMAFRHFHGMLN